MTYKMPLFMGAMMGLMIPTMIMSGMGAAFGLGFVLAHVGIVLGAVAIAWIGLALGRPEWSERLPATLLAHRPRWSHVPVMILGFSVAFGLVHIAHVVGWIGGA